MTLTIASSDESWTSPPRMRLDVASTNTGPLAVPNNSTIAVHRIHPDGTRHRVLTEVNARVIGGAWIGYDYHAPYDSLVSYVVTAAGHESAATAGLLVQSGDPGRPIMWLVHNSEPELSVPVAFITKFGDLSQPWDGELHDIAQSPYPLPRALGPRKAGSDSITVAVLPEHLAAVKQLLADSGTLLLNWPVQDGREISWLWVQPQGVQYGRIAGQRGTVYSTVSIPYAIVAQPDTDLTPLWTDGDVGDTYATDQLAGDAYLTDTGRGTNIVGT